MLLNCNRLSFLSDGTNYYNSNFFGLNPCIKRVHCDEHSTELCSGLSKNHCILTHFTVFSTSFESLILDLYLVTWYMIRGRRIRTLIYLLHRNQQIPILRSRVIQIQHFECIVCLLKNV